MTEKTVLDKMLEVNYRGTNKEAEMSGLASTEQLVTYLLTDENHHLEGCNRGLLEVISSHFELKTTGLTIEEMINAIRACDGYKELGGTN